MRKRVILFGSDVPVYECDADSAAEAINAFSRQTKVLNPIPGEHRPVFKVLGHDGVEDLLDKTREDSDIVLVPAMMGGGGRGGFMQILIGAVLIAASFIPGLQGVTVLGMSITSMLLSMGISMMLGGLLQLISPAPSLDTGPQGQDTEASRYLGTPKNTVQSGTRIPLAYGENKVYGQFLSFNIQAS